jgi:hypothetical protein
MYCTNDDQDDCTKFDDRVRTGLPYIKKFGLEDLLYKYGVDGMWIKLLFDHNDKMESI